MAEDLTLSHEEIVILTGYKRADAQLAELQRQGFHRARRNAIGHIVLERAHYAAVCAGMDAGLDAGTRSNHKRLNRAPKLAFEEQ